ncbi:MAG: response regulator [Elusimicrobia bacterium]|nr:response regulator [Elusimicrobiota bacterium]
MSEGVVLLVDDDETDVEFFRQAVREACPAARVEDLPDGQEAVDYLSGRGKFADRGRFPAPAYLVLDVKLPRLTGLEVLAWLRSKPEFAALAVTVLSGSQLDSDRETAERLGAEYIVKPVGYAELLDIARELCRRLFGENKLNPP